MPKISVIVPVYNTEKYLRKCLDSIISQTYQDFEIIIINDGSTDNSQEIIDEYVKKYPTIVKEYVKENGGLSSARNYGIKNANGEYLCFIDSDDYIENNLFENLKEEINKEIELIKFKLIRVDESYKEIERIDGPIFQEKNGQEAFNILAFKDVLLEPACIYLYKRELFIDNSFEFAIDKYHEDFGLIPLIMAKCKTVSSLDIFGYYYLQTNESITRNKDYKKMVKRANDLIYHYDNMVKQINKWELSKKTMDNIKQYYTNSILNASSELKKEEQSLYKTEIKKRKLIKNIRIRNIRSLVKKTILIIKF